MSEKVQHNQHNQANHAWLYSWKTTPFLSEEDTYTILFPHFEWIVLLEVVFKLTAEYCLAMGQEFFIYRNFGGQFT